MRQKAEHQADLRTQLQLALRNGTQICLNYQPIIDAETEQLVKTEALIRWKHPSLGFIPPDEFIPLAEQSGLIQQVGRRVRDLAFSQLAQWREQGNNLGLSINLSTAEFWSQQIDQEILSLKEHWQLPDQTLTVEITESLLGKNQAHIQQVLENLGANGVRIALDDFGTGYSSLSYLTNYPIDEIKIDRSFVNLMFEDEKRMAVVEAIIGMASTLNISITAEGVETEQQYQHLKQLGCNLIQGYHFSKPLPANEVLNFKADSRLALL